MTTQKPSMIGNFLVLYMNPVLFRSTRKKTSSILDTGMQLTPQYFRGKMT